MGVVLTDIHSAHLELNWTTTAFNLHQSIQSCTPTSVINYLMIYSWAGFVGSFCLYR